MRKQLSIIFHRIGIWALGHIYERVVFTMDLAGNVDSIMFTNDPSADIGRDGDTEQSGRGALGLVRAEDRVSPPYQHLSVQNEKEKAT